MIRTAALLFLFILVGCERSDNFQTTTLSGAAMTMHYRVVVGEPLTRIRGKAVQRIIREAFSEIDKVYNKWNRRSEVSKLNRSLAGQKIPLSEALTEFLKQTGKVVKLSGGKFDPTIEPLQQLWKSKLEQGQIPSTDEIELYTRYVGWDKVHIQEGLFWKDHDETSLDLGGIAKGYAIDLILERLNQEGYPDVYVEWGGEIRTSGRHPEGRPWRVLVSKWGNPDPSSAVAFIDLIDEAVASSGDYLQNWTVGGATYFHIIDPDKGGPLIARGDTVCGATVIAPSCMLADGLATVAMTFPSPEEAKEWLSEAQKEVPGIQYWIFSRNSKENKNSE